MRNAPVQPQATQPAGRIAHKRLSRTTSQQKQDHVEELSRREWQAEAENWGQEANQRESLPAADGELRQRGERLDQALELVLRRVRLQRDAASETSAPVDACAEQSRKRRLGAAEHRVIKQGQIAGGKATGAPSPVETSSQRRLPARCSEVSAASLASQSTARSPRFTPSRAWTGNESG